MIYMLNGYNLKKIALNIFYLFCAVILFKLAHNYYKTTGTYAMSNYLPSEESKVIDFTKYNDFPVTLEEEVVSQMAPIVVSNESTHLNYQPILEGLHDAAPIDYEGVI